jgi:hypothetical protein
MGQAKRTIKIKSKELQFPQKPIVLVKNGAINQYLAVISN